MSIALKKSFWLFFLMVALWFACLNILKFPMVANSVFLVVVILSLLYLFYCIRHEEKKQAKQTLVISILCIISVMFWSFYFQMFLSLTLFIARVVKPTLFGIVFPAPYYVAVQSFGLIVFGFLLTLKKNETNQLSMREKQAINLSLR